MHTHTYITYAYMHTHMYIRTWTYMYSFVYCCMYIRTYAYNDTRINFTNINPYTYVYMFHILDIYGYVHSYMYIHIFIHTLNNTYIHTLDIYIVLCTYCNHTSIHIESCTFKPKGRVTEGFKV